MFLFFLSVSVALFSLLERKTGQTFRNCVYLQLFMLLRLIFCVHISHFFRYFICKSEMCRLCYKCILTPCHFGVKLFRTHVALRVKGPIFTFVNMWLKISAVVFGHVFLPLWTKTVTVNLLKAQGGDENPMTQVQDVNLRWLSQFNGLCLLAGGVSSSHADSATSLSVQSGEDIVWNVWWAYCSQTSCSGVSLEFNIL